MQKNLSKISDEELVKLICQKDQELFSEIVRRYQNKLFFYIKKYIWNAHDAEDICQDVFLKVFRNLQGFDIRRKFSSWIYRISHNETINFIRFNSRVKIDSLDQNEYLKNTLGNWDRLEEKLDRKENLKNFKKIVDTLPLKYRDVLILKYYEEKSYEEMSDILRKPVNTIGTLVNRAKLKLKALVSKPKHETRNPKQIQNPNNQNSKLLNKII